MINPTQPSKNLIRDYYLFFIGQQISAFGSSLVSFAIIWYITISTGSAFYLGIASIATFAPMMAVQFISGYLSDYFNRKNILITVDFLQAVATTVLVVVFLLNMQSLLWIFGLLFVRGLFEGLHRPAKGAILPSMVPKKELQRVNALESTSRSLINLLSPALGAFIVISFSTQFWLILTVDLITFVIAIIPLLFISIPDVRSESSKDESFKLKFLGGFSFLRKSTGLLPLLFIFAMFNFFITPASMLLPLIVLSARGFQRSEIIYAMIMIVSNIGFLVMSTFLSKYKLDLPSAKGVIFGFSITIVGLLTITYSLYLQHIFLFMIGQLIIGLSLPVVNVFSSLIWQTQVPAQLQGRTISVRMIVTIIALPLVMLFAGIIADVISFSLFFALSTIGFTVMIVLIWIFTDFKLLDRLDNTDLVVLEKENKSSSHSQSISSS